MIHKTCGSGLARESVLPVASSSTDTPLSRASPLPQGICVYLALATCQAPSILPSPVMSPAFLSMTKVYSGLPS
ncbi:hypothetical protein FHG55_18330 [Pseudomonas jessenii]|uniref:Uncharacterized protein n=2 Tax=Pseudomonas TaxID=286 RepID=A0A5C4KWS3_PSEJE|nr:hypothetical protein E3Z29_01965 [Pseudomonas sp. S150]QBX44207.1 hypothetical protein E4T63_27875 [Pseudomonas fluorescens]TNB93680.1 hypothetical protein FHG55_18330 [Pseudomonas jessenii]